MLLADLDELPDAFDRHPLWSARRAAPVRFRRADYLGDPELPLADAARDLVADRTGRRPDGPVRLLTMARTLGVGYNPVSFYYLYTDTETVQAMIAEVTNTPWGEAPLLRDRAPRTGSAARWEDAEADARLPVHADGADLRVEL